MDWEPADDKEQAVLKRIVALLLAFADLAEMTVARTPAVRVFVLWLLLGAEAAARNLVTAAPAPCPFHHAGTSRADAMRLARRFRNLARLLDRQATPASAIDCDGIGDAGPAWAMLRRMLQLAGTPSLVDQLVFRTRARDTLPVAGFPDTS